MSEEYLKVKVSDVLKAISYQRFPELKGDDSEITVYYDGLPKDYETKVVNDTVMVKCKKGSIPADLLITYEYGDEFNVKPNPRKCYVFHFDGDPKNLNTSNLILCSYGEYLFLRYYYKRETDSAINYATMPIMITAENIDSDNSNFKSYYASLSAIDKMILDIEIKNLITNIDNY